jgi:hypothetical protein
LSHIKVAAILKVRQFTCICSNIDYHWSHLRHTQGSFISAQMIGHHLMSSHLLVSLSIGLPPMAILNQQFLIRQVRGSISYLILPSC